MTRSAKNTGCVLGAGAGLALLRAGRARACRRTVKEVSLDDYSSPTRPDAIFVWNCFEQMDNPWDVMMRIRSLVSRHGLVGLHVPNAEFYRQPAKGAPHWFRALSYNNLLGFPYLNGYSLGALKRLLTSSGFEPVATFATSLLTPPSPEISGSLRKEWQETRIGTENRGAANGPWIEIVGRAVSSPSSP